MKEGRRISTVLVVALVLSGAWNGWLFMHRNHTVEPTDPVVALALNVGRKSTTGRSLTMSQKCASMASLYVQSGLLTGKATGVDEHIIANRSRDELGMEYMQDGCSAGMLLVMNAIMQDRAQEGGTPGP